MGSFFINLLLHDSCHTIVIEILWEKWWRIHEGSIWVGDDDSCCEYVISIRTTDIETTIEEWFRISIHTSIKTENIIGCLISYRTDIPCSITSSSTRCTYRYIDTSHIGHFFCDSDISIFYDECPARRYIWWSIAIITVDDEVTIFYDKCTDPLEFCSSDTACTIHDHITSYRIYVIISIESIRCWYSGTSDIESS